MRVSKILFALVALFLGSCQDEQPHPAGRLIQGEFSFVTPDGWTRTSLPGLDFQIIGAPADAGARPNLFVENIFPEADLEKLARQVIERNKSTHPSYKLLTQESFETKSLLKGIKICAQRKNEDQLELTIIHYLISDGKKCLLINAICAASVQEKYKAVFDSCLRSTQSSP